MASIHHLREIARINREFGNKSSRAFFRPSKSLRADTQVRLLAQKLIGSVSKEAEEEWAQEIVGCERRNRRYVVVRSHLKRLLLSRLFHLDIRTGPEYRKAVYQTAREVFWIRMLVMFGAQQAAMWLLPRALARARKFELTGERIELLIRLRQNAVLDGDLTRFDQAVSELAEAEELHAAEQRMRTMNGTINVRLVRKADPPEDAIALVKSAWPEAARIFELHPTFNIGLDYFRIATLAAESSEDVISLLRLCVRSQQFFGRFPHMMTPLTEGQFALKRFRAAVATREFATANRAIPDCESCFPEGGNNWFIWKEIEMLLRLHENETDFSKAAALHRSVVTNDRFASQPEQVRQKWAFFGYYAAFAAWKLDQSFPFSKNRDFKKVLKEVPIYTHDKAGYNASLLILQQLIYAATGDVDGMFNKGDALRQYVKRNLRGKRTSRLYAFIHMVLTLHATDFDIPKTERLAHRSIDRFRQSPDTFASERESLPYSLMWRWIAEGIQTHRPDLQIWKSQPRIIVFPIS